MKNERTAKLNENSPLRLWLPTYREHLAATHRRSLSPYLSPLRRVDMEGALMGFKPQVDINLAGLAPASQKTCVAQVMAFLGWVAERTDQFGKLAELRERARATLKHIKPNGHTRPTDKALTRQQWARLLNHALPDDRSLLIIHLATAARPGELLLFTDECLHRVGENYEIDITANIMARYGRAYPRLKRGRLPHYLPASAFRHWEGAMRRLDRMVRRVCSQCGRVPGQNRLAVNAPCPQCGAPVRKYDRWPSYHAYRHAVAQIARRAGLPPTTPHQIRHTAATWLGNTEGATLAQVQQMLAHANPATTMIYMKQDQNTTISSVENMLNGDNKE